MKAYAEITHNKHYRQKIRATCYTRSLRGCRWNLRVDVMLAEIATLDLKNTKQVCFLLDRDLRYLGPQNELTHFLT